MIINNKELFITMSYDIYGKKIVEFLGDDSELIHEFKDLMSPKYCGGLRGILRNNLYYGTLSEISKEDKDNGR